MLLSAYDNFPTQNKSSQLEQYSTNLEQMLTRHDVTLFLSVSCSAVSNRDPPLSFFGCWTNVWYTESHLRVLLVFLYRCSVCSSVNSKQDHNGIFVIIQLWLQGSWKRLFSCFLSQIHQNKILFCFTFYWLLNLLLKIYYNFISPTAKNTSA